MHIHRKLIVLFVLSVLLILTSCVSKITKIEAFPQMYNEQPLSILILPPINQTTAAEAKEYYSTTIAEPLSLMGYYIFPIEVTTEMLKNVGLYDTELFINTQPQKFKEYFGADAIFYVKILKWNTSYFVLGGNVTVSLDCMLKSTKSGQVLWKYNGTLVVDTSGSGGAYGLSGLIVKAIATAITTAATDYVPIARRTNVMILNSMPYGKYHSLYNQDSSMQIIKQEGETTDNTNK